MNVYVINLKKNDERMKKMDVQLRALNIEYERFDAIYGNDITKDEMGSLYNAFAWWCTQGYRIRLGQLGCALSHLELYRKLLMSDKQCCCIMEDDLEIRPMFPNVLSYIENHIDINSPQVVLLHKHFSDRAPVTNDIHLVEIAYERCADAYVINKKAAASLLEQNFPVKRPCDHWSMFARNGRLRLFQAFPTTCGQIWDSNYKSDVYAGDCIDVRKMNLVKLGMWKCKRVIGKVLARIVGL